MGLLKNVPWIMSNQIAASEFQATHLKQTYKTVAYADLGSRPHLIRPPATFSPSDAEKELFCGTIS